MLNARPTTRTSIKCLILSACVAVGLSLEARGQELLEFADNASMSGVASGSPLDRLPNILGDFFQSTRRFVPWQLLPQLPPERELVWEREPAPSYSTQPATGLSTSTEATTCSCRATWDSVPNSYSSELSVAAS
jgi:hypothetical protein